MNPVGVWTESGNEWGVPGLLHIQWARLSLSSMGHHPLCCLLAHCPTDIAKVPSQWANRSALIKRISPQPFNGLTPSQSRPDFPCCIVSAHPLVTPCECSSQSLRCSPIMPLVVSHGTHLRQTPRGHPNRPVEQPHYLSVGPSVCL